MEDVIELCPVLCGVCEPTTVTQVPAPFKPVSEQRTQQNDREAHGTFKPVPEQRTQQQTDTQDHGLNNVIIVVCAVAAAMLLLFALYMARLHAELKKLRAEIKHQRYEVRVSAAMEEGE